MFKKIKRGNYYVVPKAIARLKKKYINHNNTFDFVFHVYYEDFRIRSDKGDIKSFAALKQMIYLEINNYFWLATIVLYVDVAPEGTLLDDVWDLIGADGINDIRDSFIELGFCDEEIDHSPNSASLLSPAFIEELRKYQT